MPCQQENGQDRDRDRWIERRVWTVGTGTDFGWWRGGGGTGGLGVGTFWNGTPRSPMTNDMTTMMAWWATAGGGGVT